MALALAAFFSVAVVDGKLGGSASSGKLENGIYFLGAKGHFTEVTKTVYDRVALLEAALLALWPSMFASAVLVEPSGKRGSSDTRAA